MVSKVLEVIKINSDKWLSVINSKNILCNTVYSILKIIKEGEKEWNIGDKVILLTAENIYNKADSALFLLSNNRFNGVDSIIRSIYESCKNLEFITKEDTENRALSFDLSINYAIEKTLKNNNEISKKSFEDHIAKFIPRNQWSKVFPPKGILYPDHWRSIAEYKNGRKIKSLKQLCIYLGDQNVDQFDVLYSHLSMESHGSLIKTYNDWSGIDSTIAQLKLINKYIIETIDILNSFYCEKIPGNKEFN